MPLIINDQIRGEKKVIEEEGEEEEGILEVVYRMMVSSTFCLMTSCCCCSCSPDPPVVNEREETSVDSKNISSCLTMCDLSSFHFISSSGVIRLINTRFSFPFFLSG